MTLDECYKKLGGSYKEVFGRLQSDSLIEKLLIKFKDDPSLSDLRKYYEKNDIDNAFRAVHTLKGVCQNLGFERLAESSAILTEVLRSGSFPHSDDLLKRIGADYSNTIASINEYENSL